MIRRLWARVEYHALYAMLVGLTLTPIALFGWFGWIALRG